MSDIRATTEERDRRGVWLAVWGLVIMLGGLYLVGWLLLGSTVPDDTRVAGVDIGGMAPDRAADHLEYELADRVDDPIPLVWQGQRFELDPVAAGLRLDAEASVRAAGGGRSWNPLDMMASLLSSGDVRPVIDVDERAFNAALDRIADQIDLAPVEPRVVFAASGGRTVLQARSGHVLDRPAVTDDIVTAYLRSDRPVQLRIDAVEASVGGSEVAKALNQVAKPAISGPIRLRLPNTTVELTVPQFAPALILRGRDGALAPSFDVGRLSQTTAVLRQRIDVPPRNARIVLRNGRPAIIPSRPGRRLAPAHVADAIAPVLTRTGSARSVEVGTSVWPAAFSTEDARKLGVRRVVSSYTTGFPRAGYLNVNLRRATKLINGTVLKPGETFSFNQAVGPRNRDNGFTRGNDQRRGSVATSLGGGVSQVSTTLFNAAFFAGLHNVQHHTHAVFNERYPLGREAIVSWPGGDLRFKNTTPYGVLVQTGIDRSTPRHRGQVHVRMWSTKYWDITAGRSNWRNVRQPDRTFDRSRRCNAQPGQRGFDVAVYRFFRRHGSDKLDHKETIWTSYLPVDRVVCHPRRDRGDRGRGR
jgi:vancomycin resistance protein YoaR